MSYWKRAILYLTRKKRRTILLTVLLLVMSCFILVGLSLKSNADKEAERLRQSLGTGFKIKSDTKNETYYEKYYEEGYSYKLFVGPNVTDEMINQILGIDGVTDYMVSLSDPVWADLELKPGLWADSDADQDTSEGELKLWRQYTLVLPCKKGELNANFRTGSLTILEGRNIQEGDHFKAVISEWLAEKNNIGVGDTITVGTKEGMFGPSENPLKTLGKLVELEIVGLFHTNFEQAASDFTAENAYVENMIYTDMDTHMVLQKNLGKEKRGNGYGEVTFFVRDSAKLDFIMKKIKESDDINVEGLLVKSDDVAYKASVKPFHQISMFASIILAAGIIGLGLILYLVMNLWVKGRKHETGVLLSIGIGKGKIMSQMLIECLMITGIALILSILLSGVLVNTCALMAERITTPKAVAETYRVGPTSGLDPIPVAMKTSSDEVKLDHSISLLNVLIAIVMVCGASIVSVLLASMRVLNIELKNLLQSM